MPKFTNDQGICAGDSLKFSDESDGQGRPLVTWLWNFGDSVSGEANTSKLQNPAHVFSAGGTYKVNLTVTNESNCEPVTIVQEVRVLRKPVADFSTGTTVCETVPVNFTDRSVLATAKISKWNWDFGDGQVSTEQNPAHVFIKAGTYEVTLTAGADQGCLSDPVKKNIIVYSPPVVDFEMPEVCLADTRAQFTDKSVVAGDVSKVKYMWDFGDPNANAQRPNSSALQNPAHIYTAAGNYQVTLTVTSPQGCEVKHLKIFTVNGSVPKAQFTVLNADKLCSSQPVIFEDRASVDFGELTKIEWIFDLDNEPESKVVDENPNRRSDTAKRYEYQYAIFNTPASKTFKVKMLAYSGQVCVNEQIIDIVLNAEPELIFDTLASVCIDKAPFQITQGRLLNDIPGQGIYSGPGVSANGMFNPAAAGAGEHTLTYTFSATNSCLNFQTQTIRVSALPLATAGDDFNVLEGEGVKIDAKASGDSLIYKWTPSTGLDRDDILNPVASPVEDITYTLSITSNQGCGFTDEVSVKVLKTPIIPNAFTPNNDGVNDEWNIKHLNSYPEVVVEVFNRYGNKVYTSLGYTEAWNGKFNGSDLPVGTYYYIINPKSGRKTVSGAVTIIR